jgi:hypothetical protein
MGDTQTSVREVIPDIGGNFDLDQSVIDGKPFHKILASADAA